MNDNEILTATNAEEKGYFSETDLKSELREQLEDKVNNEFESVNLNSTDAHEALDRTVDMTVMENIENVERVEIDGETYYKSTEGLDVEDFASKEIDKMDRDSILETGILEAAFENQYNISEEVKESGDFASKIVEFNEYQNEVVEIEGSNIGLQYEFNEDLAFVSSNYQGSGEFMTREEGIEHAVESGQVDLNELAEATSHGEVVNALEKASGEAIDNLADNQQNVEFIEAVAENQNSSSELLDKLANSDNESIREAAQATLESKEVEVQGDHATVKEQTMAGEESERVVNRDAGLDELDKTAGKDSDKFETKEENVSRDGLSNEEAKLLSSLEDKSEKTLADGIDAYNSNSKNGETSEKQGEHDSEAVKQK